MIKLATYLAASGFRKASDLLKVLIGLPNATFETVIKVHEHTIFTSKASELTTNRLTMY